MSNEGKVDAPAVPQGWKLVQTPITEEMHVAAVKVLHRAPGLAGLPQRILDAMLAATPAPAPADGRGTDAQIQKERDIARHAIVGALAAGYAGQAHPGADHWLAAAHDAGVRIKSLEAPAPAVPSGRTELEIVEQTEELAAYLMHWRFGQEPESPSVKFRDTENVKAQKCWAAACHIQEMITATDVENAVAEVDDAPSPAPAQEVDDMVPRAALHEVERERDYYKSRTQTMYEHQQGEVWYWQGDGEDHPESWVNSLPVVIRADQLRELMAKPAQEVGLTDQERADMACAVAAICTGTSSRTAAATAIEWTERALRAKGASDA